MIFIIRLVWCLRKCGHSTPYLERMVDIGICFYIFIQSDIASVHIGALESREDRSFFKHTRNFEDTIKTGDQMAQIQRSSQLCQEHDEKI